jgi:hypothetical protein
VTRIALAGPTVCIFRTTCKFGPFHTTGMKCHIKTWSWTANA